MVTSGVVACEASVEVLEKSKYVLCQRYCEEFSN